MPGACGEDDEVQQSPGSEQKLRIALAQARAYQSYFGSPAQREALINKITTAIRSSLDPQDIFCCHLTTRTSFYSLPAVPFHYGKRTGCVVYQRQKILERLLICLGVVLRWPLCTTQQMLRTQQPVVLMISASNPEMGLDLPLRSPALSAFSITVGL